MMFNLRVASGKRLLKSATTRVWSVLKKHGLSFAMAVGAVVSVVVAGFGSFAEECERVSDEVLRLHIVAASNSPEDQQFKYELRDYILRTFSPVLGSHDSLEAAREKSMEALPEIERAAREFAAERFGDRLQPDINAQIVEMYFTTRVYDGFTLPAGNYVALKIVVGEGQGDNWWCVMFPPLCVPAVGENAAVDAINIPKSANVPKVKFAVYEFLSERMAQKNSSRSSR